MLNNKYNEEELNYKSQATNLWCDLTNFLISKYKAMTQNEPERAVKELTDIVDLLEENHYLQDYNYTIQCSRNITIKNKIKEV